MLRSGITTPVLTLLPGSHAPWEDDGTIADVVRIAQAADRLGYDFITCSEHVIVPTDVAAVRGSRYWDPLATFGYLAAHTDQVRLMTNVLVIGYHHPLEIAKRYGTLDQVSGGRLVLGLGVGSLREEFELLDVPFADRGARADDSLRALRAALSQREPEYSGSHHSFGDVVVDPCAIQERVPFWIGGRTGRSLRRAITLGDGWCPFGLSSEEITGMLSTARSSETWHDRDDPLEVVLANNRPIDPLADPGHSRATLASLAEAGATRFNLRLVHHSVDHYVEQLEAAAALVDEVLPD